MSIANTKTYDVFLSCSAIDKVYARLVELAFSTQDIDVFQADAMRADENWREMIWNAMAESAAMVLVLPSAGAMPSNTLLEIGAATAWNKPIFLISINDRAENLPSYLHDQRVYPLARLDDVVSKVKAILSPMSEENLQNLTRIYQEMAIPTDRLISMPVAIEELARRYESAFGKAVSGEQLVESLIRLRKMGKLPRLSEQRKRK